METPQDAKRHPDALAPVGGPAVRGMYAVSTRIWGWATSGQKVGGEGGLHCLDYMLQAEVWTLDVWLPLAQLIRLHVAKEV